MGGDLHKEAFVEIPAYVAERSVDVRPFALGQVLAPRAEADQHFMQEGPFRLLCEADQRRIEVVIGDIQFPPQVHGEITQHADMMEALNEHHEHQRVQHLVIGHGVRLNDHINVLVDLVFHVR